MRPVPEELAVTGRGFRILVNGDNDRLDVVIAPALMHTYAPSFGKGLDEWRLTFAVAEVADCGIYHGRASRIEEIH
jgi:hypothetical protein